MQVQPKIEPLASLCLDVIVKNDALLGRALRTAIPESLLEDIKNQFIISKWKWFITPLKQPQIYPIDRNLNHLFLTSKTHEDFKTLYRIHPFERSEFVTHKGQQIHRNNTILKLLDFITKFEFEITIAVTPKEIIEAPPGLFGKHIDRTTISLRKFGTLVRLATINFPYKTSQNIHIGINPLQNINRYLVFGTDKSAQWDENTYNDLQSFLVYYVNQAALDENWQVTKTRIADAKHCTKEEDLKKCLFGEQNMLKDGMS